MSIKAKIFKLDRLNKKDVQNIHHWLHSLRWVWNEGLRLLMDLDAFTGVYSEEIEVDGKPKKIYHRVPCCPVPWQYTRIDRDKPWKQDNIVPYTYFAGKKPYAQFCPIQPSSSEAIEFTVTEPRAIWWLKEEGLNPLLEPGTYHYETRSIHDHYRQPKLDNPSYFSLCKYFAQKNHRDKPWLTAIPSTFVRGTCRSLAKSWVNWKSGKGGKPKFKSARFPLTTLMNEDAKNIKVTRLNDRDGLILIPKLGTFRVKHLWSDWGDQQISVLKVTAQPDGYYLQLTGRFEDEAVKEVDRKVLITASKTISPLLGTSDDGKRYKAFSPDPKLLLKKERLQQQLSRQQYLSKRWHKTKVKLGRVEQLIAQQAKCYNHKLSTFICRTYGKIELDGVGKRRVLRKPKKKERAKTINPLVFDPNGAEAVAAYNRNLASQRSGQFVALVKQKAKVLGREMIAK